MKKVPTVLAWTLAVCMITAVPAPSARSEVNVNIGIGIPLPPPLVIPVPPPIVPIPRTDVYFPPTVDVDILFFGGYWYRPYRDHWFRARSYNGPWIFVEPRYVPRSVIAVPPGYRHIPHGHQHIPYGQFKKNWDRWDRERYWYRDHDWQSEYWQPRGKPPHYRDGYGHNKPKHDNWHDGGPPGHRGQEDRWGGPPPGPPRKGDKWDRGGPPGHQGEDSWGGGPSGPSGRGKGH